MVCLHKTDSRITISMVQNSFLRSQHLLIQPRNYKKCYRNLKFHNRINKSSSRVPTLNQMNPAHFVPPVPLRPVLILSSHKHVSLPTCLLLSGVHHQKHICIYIFSYVRRTTCSAHPIWLDCVTLKWTVRQTDRQTRSKIWALACFCKKRKHEMII